MTARRMSLSAIVLMVICVGWTMTTDARTTQEPTAPSPQTPEVLARTSGCLDCHALDRKVIGPAFRDIAARYRDSTGARDYLIQVVKRGGKGKWTDVTGGVPMPPHSYSLSDAEVQRLVDWVLGLGR